MLTGSAACREAADSLPGVLSAQVDPEVAFVDFAEVYFVEGLEFKLRGESPFSSTSFLIPLRSTIS